MLIVIAAADGEIVSYQWNFGDGNTSMGRIVTQEMEILQWVES
jgi:hypothetical protein